MHFFSTCISAIKGRYAGWLLCFCSGAVIFLFFFVSISVALSPVTLHLCPPPLGRRMTVQSQLGAQSWAAGNQNLVYLISRSSFSVWLLAVCSKTVTRGFCLIQSLPSDLSSLIHPLDFISAPVSEKLSLRSTNLFSKYVLTGTLIVEFIHRFSSEGKEIVMWD